MKKTFAVLLGALTLCLSTGISASAVNCDNIIMQNDYLTLYVGQEKQNLGRYQLSANKGDLINHGDDEKNLMYENFYSSYTTVTLNGRSCRFGEGETIKAPYYDKESDSCITVQSFGDLEVTQTLSFADGMSTEHDDMLLVSYTLNNTGTDDVLSGIRIMIDSQLDKDDKGTLTVDTALLDFEKEYSNTIPSVWSVVSSDGMITAYGKVNTIPDSIVFADWSSLFDKKWDYHVNNSKDISDSAAALTWDNRTLQAGEKQEVSVYYGVKNLRDKTPDEPVDTPDKPVETPDTDDQPSEVISGDDPENSIPDKKPADFSGADDQPSEISFGDNTDNIENNSPDNNMTGQDTPLTGEKGLFISSLIAALTLSVFAIAVFRSGRKGGSRNEK